VRDGLVDGLAVRGGLPSAARALIGAPVAALAPLASGKNPADIVGEVLAATGAGS
jgi:hypothetical protein